MLRKILQTLTGLALLWGAWTLHTNSVAVTKETISPPPPLTSSDLPPDPRDVVEQPGPKAKLRDAESLSMVSLLVAGAGGLLTLFGLVPLLVWALFGRGQDDTPEAPKPEPPIPGKGEGDVKPQA